MTESPPKKASRWVLFLALTLCINYFAPMFTMITKNPPRKKAFRMQVIGAMFFTLLPFLECFTFGFTTHAWREDCRLHGFTFVFIVAEGHDLVS